MISFNLIALAVGAFSLISQATAHCASLFDFYTFVHLQIRVYRYLPFPCCQWRDDQRLGQRSEDKQLQHSISCKTDSFYRSRIR